MQQSQPQTQFEQIIGYLAIPHELLHVMGYRLVGQRCDYQWGKTYVTTVTPMSLQARLVGLLFPFIIFGSLFFVCAILSGLTYTPSFRSGNFYWFVLWLMLGHLTGLYTCTAIGDLRKAYLLVLNKPWYSWTPFDIFYWPFVDWSEIRKKVLQEHHDKEN